jgi:replicative DNA helicase
VATHYDQFDEMTAGLQPSELVIVAARPGMGKTAFACDVASNVAIRNAGVVGIFSLEMSREALVSRLLCAQARVDSHRFRRGIFSEEERDRIIAAYRLLEANPLYIDDTAALGLPEMRVRARRLKMKAGRLDLVVVDYLQLMTPPLSARRAHANREQEVSAISRGLKAMAKELECPVMALAQLSRAPEVRSGDHRPILSDLRDSGGIEQDADIVCFLYREEVYKPKDEDLHGVAELIVAKQRNGPTGMMKLAFLRSYAHFEASAYERQPGEDG